MKIRPGNQSISEQLAFDVFLVAYDQFKDLKIMPDRKNVLLDNTWYQVIRKIKDTGKIVFSVYLL